MTALAQAAKAYGNTHSHIRTPRGTEYEVMARATRALKAAAKNKDTSCKPGLVQALHDNRLIWTHLAASVADSENALDPELRAKLFYLAEFTTSHSRKVLQENADIDVLVEINSAVMAGLISKGS